ncbi:GTP-binding protein [Thomasclavelia cocleata]|nr:GTP-binding protein [Thomasclavelia cocleata]
MKKIVLGILAHVDAGKTTLTESVLYLSKAIRSLGRVDHGDAFLDYNVQERNRGITIFSKQAVFNWNDCQITLIDTPGHVDFSTEMERTLQVLDYAILVISGIDGVQVHSETIWKLLQHYQIPTFIFINKMDNIHANKEELLSELKKRLSEQCYDFENLDDDFYENIA